MLESVVNHGIQLPYLPLLVCEWVLASTFNLQNAAERPSLTMTYYDVTASNRVNLVDPLSNTLSGTVDFYSVTVLRQPLLLHCYCIPQKFDLTGKQIDAAEEKSSEQVVDTATIISSTYPKIILT